MAFLIPLPLRKATPKAASIEVVETTGADPAQGPDPVLRLTGVDGRTRISTSFGEVPAALLRPGDQVKTLDGRFVEVLDVDKVILDEGFMDYHPEAAPVCIPEGTLGPQRPARDIYLAPDQVVGGGINEVDIRVCRASDMVERPSRMKPIDETVTYYKITLEEPCAMMCEKVWLKSA